MANTTKFHSSPRIVRQGPTMGDVRIARHRFPDGSIKDVLQTSTVMHWQDLDSGDSGVDVEWHDVPIWEVPYTPARRASAMYFYYHVAPSPRHQPIPERFDADGEDAADGAIINMLRWGEHMPIETD